MQPVSQNQALGSIDIRLIDLANIYVGFRISWLGNYLDSTLNRINIRSACFPLRCRKATGLMIMRPVLRRLGTPMPNNTNGS